MKTNEFKKLALSFPGAVEAPHFDKTAFKINGKRIFATLHEASATANLKLSLPEQSIYCTFNEKLVYPVPNKWGLRGWTTFQLEDLPEALLMDALISACKEAKK